jgi:hypothetical protein
MIETILAIIFTVLLIFGNTVLYNTYKDFYKDLPKWIRFILFTPPFSFIGAIVIMGSIFVLYIIDSIENI